MNATLTCSSSENELKEFFPSLTDHEAYMVEQFSRTSAKTKKESTLKLNKVSETLCKLFHSDDFICLISWNARQGYFLTLAAPYTLSTGSFEEEAIISLYKNATITNELIIEIPYTSL